MFAAGLCRTRQHALISAAFCATVLIFVFMFSDSLSGYPKDYVRKAHEYWTSNVDSASPTQIYNCADPYRRPGYLHIDEDSANYRNTRWIPYTDDFLDAPTPDYAQYPLPEGTDIYFNKTSVETPFVDLLSTPRQWMNIAQQEDKRRRETTATVWSEQTPQDFAAYKDDAGLGWLWGRRVLILGDSVDRFMIQFFCEEFDRPTKQPALHTIATCEIPTLNLTLVHWHYGGSFTYRPQWWWMDDMQEVAFEERMEKWWAPTIDTHVRGPSGRPDLLLWQNGLWDQRAMWEAGEAHFPKEVNMGTRARQLAWEEVRFVAARVKKLVNTLSDLFGSDVPAMFRAITVHKNSNAEDANVYELDRISRAIAEQAGHEVFEWGRLISAFSMLYKDRTHPGKGPASWLFGNMIMEYLARSAGFKDTGRAPYFDSWEACHPHLVNWGGR